MYTTEHNRQKNAKMFLKIQVLITDMKYDDS